MALRDNTIQTGNESFWEVDGYKKTVKRHEDGHKMCGELIQLIQDRADLEKAYAKSLRTWSSKWTKNVEKGPEYGTAEGAYKSLFEEARGVASIHENIKSKLVQDVQSQIKQWRQTNYTKPKVGASKENKELEDSFKTAQRSWSKKMLRVTKCKKEYHTACKQVKTATNNETNAERDSTISQEQFEKIRDKAEKSKAEVERSKNAYVDALKEVTNHRGQYVESRTDVYLTSDCYEQMRLQFFKEMLNGIVQSLDLSCTNDYQAIYENCFQDIQLADHSEDLRWWAESHGKDMAMAWPTFVDYVPEQKSISSKLKNVLGAGAGSSMTLPAIRKKDHSFDKNNRRNSEPPAPDSDIKMTLSEQNGHTPVSSPTADEQKRLSNGDLESHDHDYQGEDYENINIV